MKNYIVYQHTSPSGKSYIGITKQLPSQRWRRGEGYKENPYFYNAIKLYGWDNIEHKILYDSLSKEEAETLEIQLIRELGTLAPHGGYNIATGGAAPSPTKETRERVSASVSKLWADPIVKEKMCQSMSGVKRSETAKVNISVAQKKRFKREEERRHISEIQKGKKRSEEAKAKTSATLKAFYTDESNKEAYRNAHDGVSRKALAKRVRCVETGEIFEAVVDAEQKSGVDHRNIIAVCRGKRKHAGGYCWEYVAN